MTDYYLEDRTRLNRQPKRTIAEYVEQNGILVPRRFDSLVEARKSHKKIFLRSEHPQEYNGVSGLLDSFGLSDTYFVVKGSNDIEEIKQKYFEKEEKEEMRGTASWYKEYCKFLGLKEEDFRRQTTFSIWERLRGFNRTVVADSSILNRYHIMTFLNEKDNWILNYTIVQDGQIEQEFVKHLPYDLREGLRGLIEIYKKIRNLERFDPNHCPIMEFQTYNGKNYFLQYHRTRDFSPSTFTLERALKNGEIEVPFVRGATTEEGMNCKVTVYYSDEENFDARDEDGSYDIHDNLVFSELKVRDRKVQMVTTENLKYDLVKFIEGHLQKSKLFKPQVSIIHNIKDIMNGESDSDFYERARKGRNSYVNLHIISDGRRCFVRRLR